ncbi:spore-associated protein A [Actinocorallia populi]|uniref:spore-associated protein A n=1 Tax=Actinocorallia populi TaxID=2079200 RepID=UPI001E466DCA|nr:spore-associated protein A [Actinocorallia populi]
MPAWSHYDRNAKGDLAVRIAKKITTLGLAAVAATAGAVATAAPASAATYAGECGSGYAVVNKDAIGTKGTVFLTYNASTGKNCAIAKRNTAGSPVLIEVGLGANPVGSHWPAFQGGQFRSYAGPVYLYAPGKCVDWMGRISGTEGGKRKTNCG